MTTDSELMLSFLPTLAAAMGSSPDSRHILFVDNHSSHVNVAVIELAIHHGIEMVALPSNTTAVLQPLPVDAAVFGSFTHWPWSRSPVQAFPMPSAPVQPRHREGSAWASLLTTTRGP